SVLGLMAIMVLLALLLGTSELAYAAPDIADIAPDIDVAPLTPAAPAGGTIMYKIQVHNDNTASEDLTRIHVTLRYDPNTLTLIDSKLRDTNDWISSVDGGKATVQFGKIDRQDERSAALIFHINAAVGIGASIEPDAAFDGRTADADGSGGLAIDNVISIGPNAVLPANIAPNTGPAGTSFAVVATGFQTHEQVVTWLNTATSVQG